MAIEPITRKEQFLAKAGGQQVGVLKPITREEMFLQKIAENGGGSGGGVSPEEVATIVKEQFPGGVGYSEVAETEIYRSEEIDPNNWSYTTYNDPMPPLKVGYRYRCEVDGTAYEGVAQIDEGLTVVFLVDSDDGFMALFSDGTETLFNINGIPRPENTLVVTEIGENTGTINPKFLPEGHQFGKEVQTVNEPLNITWDGNTDGLVEVQGAYKVSDVVLTDEQIKTATLSANGQSVVLGDVWDSFQVFSDCTIAPDLGLIFCRKAGAELMGVTIPEAGVYFFYDLAGASLTTTEPVEQTKVVVTPIPSEYMGNVVRNYKLFGTYTLDELRNIIDQFDAGMYNVTIGSYHAEVMGFVYNVFKFAYYINPGEGLFVANFAPNSNGLYEFGEGIPGSINSHQELYASGVRLFDVKDETDAYYNACRIDKKCVVLESSTENSTKKFRITVDDSGAITATEV